MILDQTVSDKTLTTGQAARRLGLSRERVVSLNNEGRLPAIRTSRGRLFLTEVIERFAAERHMILITHQPARLVDLSFGQFTGLPGPTVPAYLNVELDDPEVWPKAYGLPGGTTVTYTNPAALSPEEAADGDELVGLLDEWADSALRGVLGGRD